MKSDLEIAATPLTDMNESAAFKCFRRMYCALATYDALNENAGPGIDKPISNDARCITAALLTIASD